MTGPEPGRASSRLGRVLRIIGAEYRAEPTVVSRMLDAGADEHLMLPAISRRAVSRPRLPLIRRMAARRLEMRSCGPPVGCCVPVESGITVRHPEGQGCGLCRV